VDQLIYRDLKALHLDARDRHGAVRVRYSDGWFMVVCIYITYIYIYCMYIYIGFVHLDIDFLLIDFHIF
jgi:uncharacterized membrane protein YhdT